MSSLYNSIQILQRQRMVKEQMERLKKQTNKGRDGKDPKS